MKETFHGIQNHSHDHRRQRASKLSHKTEKNEIKKGLS
jgi:hypothetical protein